MKPIVLPLAGGEVISPDVMFFFPPMPSGTYMPNYCAQTVVNRWARDRGWLPKDSKGQIEVFPGQRAEIWGGRSSFGTQYLALKFV